MPYTKDVVIQLRHQRNIFMGINIVAAISMGILFWLIVTDHNHLARQDQLIQRQRYEVNLSDCRGINRRHDNTIKILKLEFSVNPHQDENLALVIPIVNAALPKQNCVKLAHEAVSGQGG